MTAKNEFVVYVPEQGGKFKVSRVQFGMSEKSLAQHTLHLEDGGSVCLGRVAFLHITFADAAKNKQEAVEIARIRNLTFIPENILVGMRRRNPEITMSEICAEFAMRVKAYEAPPEKSAPEIDPEAMDMFGDLMKDFEGLFGGKWPGPKQGPF